MVKILLKIVNLNKFNEPKLILAIFKMSTLVADIYEHVHMSHVLNRISLFGKVTVMHQTEQRNKLKIFKRLQTNLSSVDTNDLICFTDGSVQNPDETGLEPCGAGISIYEFSLANNPKFSHLRRQGGSGVKKTC